MHNAKRMVWAFVATVAVSGLSAPPAQAGTIQDFLCRYFHLFCPPNPGGGGNGGNSVPEPASIAVLAAGACAAGLIARRRMKKNHSK